MERLRQEHLTELTAVHLDRRPGIERPAEPLLRRLVGAPGVIAVMPSLG